MPDESAAEESSGSADIRSPDVPGELLTALFQHRLALFLGAGCSIASDLPSATDLAEILCRSAHVDSSNVLLEDIAQQIVEADGRDALTRTLLPAASWKIAPCNDAHHVAAELVKEGLVACVLTTNWDVLAEKAIEHSDVQPSIAKRAKDLELYPLDAPWVIKLHGCITLPEEVKITRTDMDSEDWQSEWAGRLYAGTLDRQSVLYVGYSGASASATKTAEHLISANGRALADFLVDTRDLVTLKKDKRSSAFLAALALEESRFTQASAQQFFQALRDAVYPRILADVGRATAIRLRPIVQPTAIDGDVIEEAVDSVMAAWKEAGPAAAQAFLVAAFFAFSDARVEAPYIPMLPKIPEMTMIWMWLAMSIWLGISRGPLDPVAQLKKRDVEQRVVVCPPGSSRRTIAVLAQERLEAEYAGPTPKFVLGVMTGGDGELPPKTQHESVARRVPPGSLARPSRVTTGWTSAESILNDKIVAGPAAEVLRDSLIEHLETRIWQ